MSQKEVSTRPMSDIDFRFMSLTYTIRDLRLPRMNILKEVGIKPGFTVLDYGCGPGSYIAPLAKLVGESGQIYALDVHPLAIQAVQRIASQKKLTSVQTILSDCQTGLPPASVDVVLLYDILHDLIDCNRVLAELHRILKDTGILSVNDHHLKRDEITSKITSNGLFKLATEGKMACSFTREEP
jgi:ubiquinone/menaquinone biosynthesis C-methylase UbiE